MGAVNKNISAHREKASGLPCLQTMVFSLDKVVIRQQNAKMGHAPPLRIHTAIAAAVCYFLTIIFLLLVIIGNVSKKQKALTQIYFLKLDVSDVIPLSVENAVLLNSIARSLGLHDFYTVGL